MAKFGPLDDCVVMKVCNNFIYMFASRKFCGIAISEVFDNFGNSWLNISFIFCTDYLLRNAWMICIGIRNYVWPYGRVLGINFSSILNFCIISSLHSWITICANCHSDLPPCVLHVENNRSGLLGDHVGLAM